MITSLLSLSDPPVALAVYEGGDPEGPPLLLLHGTSVAASVFERQWQAPELQHFRLIAFDLPGHGQSAAAPEHYALPALGAVVLAAMRALGLEQALVVAHSLSGHLAYGLLPALPGLRGLLTVGAPPITADADMQAAFQPHPTVLLCYAPAVSATEAGAMARFALHPDVPAHEAALLVGAIGHADGRARAGLGASLAATELGDQVGAVARTAVPLALVAGSLDHALSLPYYDTLAAPSRWGPAVHLVPGTRHTPFLESPAAFNQLLLDFALATA